MATTSVHVPESLLEALDRLAAELGTSRNRVIVRACEELLSARRGSWPTGFFESRLSPRDLAEVRAGSREMDTAIRASRRNRPARPL